MTRSSIRDVAAETRRLLSPAANLKYPQRKGNVEVQATRIILEAHCALGTTAFGSDFSSFAIARVSGHIVDESTSSGCLYRTLLRRLGLPSAMVTLDLFDPVTSRKKHYQSWRLKRGSWRRSSRHRDCLRRSVFHLLENSACRW